MSGSLNFAVRNEFALWFGFVGVPAGIRTPDPMIKSHVLYRLSYGHAGCGAGDRPAPVT